MKYLISFLFLLLGFVAQAQPVGNEYLYFSIIEVTGSDTVLIEKKFIYHSHRIKKLRIKDYRIKDLSPSHLGFRRLSMDNYYCTPINRNNSRLQIIKDGRDTMNLLINNAKGSVFLQTTFQEGNFVVNLQQKDYDQNSRKLVRNSGTTALDISRVNWREIKPIRGLTICKLFHYFQSQVQKLRSLIHNGI